METALVSVSTGVMDRLLSKLSMLLEKYYHKLRGVSKQIKLLRDEMNAMHPALLMLADEEQLSPRTKDWRDELRELSYDTEDCIDGFMARVDHEEEGPTGFFGIFGRFHKLLKALTTQHEIANEVEELKARAIEASERYRRYNFIHPASTSSSTFAIDPRLPALYEDIDRLVGIDAPMKHITERLLNDSLDELKVVSIVGCGGLGKTTLANQVYHTIKGQFPCAAFVTVSRNPDIRRILSNIAKGVGITYNKADDDVQRLIDILREHLHDKNVFPEDYEIEKQCLINRWIAEGFVHEEQERSAYEVGEHYFNDLINRSMIQPAKVEYGQADAYLVHDIILDYIKCKAAEENFLTSLDAAGHVYPSKYKIRRLSIYSWNSERVTSDSSLNPSHIRSLTIFGCVPQTSFSAFTVIRVLDLRCSQYLQYHELANIGKLFHLKYLSLKSNQITELPDEIGELQNLQTLDLRDTNIEKLPPTIRKLRRLVHLYVDSDTEFPDGIIGQMHSLEELTDYGIHSYEQAKSLQELSKLTKLKTLKMIWHFDLPDGSEGINLAEGIYIHVATVLSSHSIHNLDIEDSSDENYPLSLDSWHPATTCNLQRLCIKDCRIYQVSHWMGSLGNLRVLDLAIICVRPEDVEILGAIPCLLCLYLDTMGGTSGKITVHGSNGFRSLKFFSLHVFACGTALDFEAGSMPKLEHVMLSFRLHNTECLNGASNFGIQHLVALSMVEITIRGSFGHDSNYDPMVEADDGTSRCFREAINAAVKTLPNLPTVGYGWREARFCMHFERVVKDMNRSYGGMLTEWLNIWRIEEEQTEPATEGETEYEDEVDEEE